MVVDPDSPAVPILTALVTPLVVAPVPMPIVLALAAVPMLAVAADTVVVPVSVAAALNVAAPLKKAELPKVVGWFIPIPPSTPTTLDPMFTVVVDPLCPPVPRLTIFDTPVVVAPLASDTVLASAELPKVSAGALTVTVPLKSVVPLWVTGAENTVVPEKVCVPDSSATTPEALGRS